ncbi:hypothetical protein B0H13DRAFT_2271638 [Mycena leptocephala]|nr:hypothetical protein B0H13DRAFT_2271638 [Mycena leptocephala]
MYSVRGGGAPCSVLRCNGTLNAALAFMRALCAPSGGGWVRGGGWPRSGVLMDGFEALVCSNATHSTIAWIRAVDALLALAATVGWGSAMVDVGAFCGSRVWERRRGANFAVGSEAARNFAGNRQERGYSRASTSNKDRVRRDTERATRPPAGLSGSHGGEGGAKAATEATWRKRCLRAPPPSLSSESSYHHYLFSPRSAASGVTSVAAATPPGGLPPSLEVGGVKWRRHLPQWAANRIANKHQPPPFFFSAPGSEHRNHPWIRRARNRPKTSLIPIKNLALTTILNIQCRTKAFAAEDAAVERCEPHPRGTPTPIVESQRAQRHSAHATAARFLIPLCIFSCSPAAAFAPPNPVFVECSGQRAPSVSTSGGCNGARSSNARTSRTPSALSPARTRAPLAHSAYSTCSPHRRSPVKTTRLLHTRNLHVPRISIIRSKHIHVAHISTRRAVLMRTVATDANVNEKVQRPCDAPKGAPVAFTTASAQWKRPLRPSARREREGASLPDSFCLLRCQFRARARAHAMRTLRARSRAMQMMETPPPRDANMNAPASQTAFTPAPQLRCQFRVPAPAPTRCEPSAPALRHVNECAVCRCFCPDPRCFPIRPPIMNIAANANSRRDADASAAFTPDVNVPNTPAQPAVARSRYAAIVRRAQPAPTRYLHRRQCRPNYAGCSGHYPTRCPAPAQSLPAAQMRPRVNAPTRCKRTRTRRPAAGFAPAPCAGSLLSRATFAAASARCKRLRTLTHACDANVRPPNDGERGPPRRRFHAARW